MRTPGYIPKHMVYAGAVHVRTSSCVQICPPIIRHKRPPDITLRMFITLMAVSVASLLLLTSSITG